MSEPPVLSVERLRFEYEGAPVLEDLSFEVGRGEVFVIVGPSGCGKSTLLRLALGLLRPTSGTIRVLGRDPSAGPPEALRSLHRRIGVLFQGAALFSSMTLEDNVAAPVREHTTLPDRLVRTLARMKLASVGLDASRGHHPSEASGGMRKRAGIARALALDPEVLFLDEPSAGLDPVTAGGLDDLILYLKERIGLTQIVVSHELPSIFRIADRILMLREGRIIAEGSREDILYSQDPRVLDFLLRNAPDLEAGREALEATREPAS